MATTHESNPPAGSDPLDVDLIDLEPTVAFDAVPADASASFAPTRRRGAIALVEGTLASLAGETNDLRRSRLFASALFLAPVYGFLLLWFAVSKDTTFGAMTWVMALRFALTAGVLALLWSRVPLSPGGLRAVEYALFGGLAALVAVAQYSGNLELARRGDLLDMVAFEKLGVIHLFTLMVIYGFFIPNNPWTTARVVFTMALGLLAAVVFLLEEPEVAEVSEFLRSTDEAGSNAIVLVIGAALAVYGAYILNSLRTQLHEATKYGQYQLRQKLGQGGMGEVYLAEHQLLKRPCALKLIRPDSYQNPVALARFEREVQSAAKLTHPNTIEIFDYGHTEDGTFYYVMEYLPGLSLADLVRMHGPLPPGRVVYLMRQICAGLAEAHALGLIHRDLKPANIHVTVRGGEPDVAKVLDFGLVKVTREEGQPELTADQTVSGTPSYMSPEQATGERDYDARADIYALGAIAYFALTGRPPFEGESPVAIMIAHARDPVVPPSQHRPEIPADLERIVLRCLSKKPAERFGDVKELGRALAACAAASDWDAEQAERWWRDVTFAAEVEKPAGTETVPGP